MSSDDALRGLLAANHLGTLATTKRDGRPQLSNVSYVSDPGVTLIRVSITETRAKTANMRRDPRVAMLTNGANGWSYAVAEGAAELSPVAADSQDATVEELVEIYRLLGGEHPDWDEYRAAMVTDQRLVLRLHVDRVYGLVR